MPALDRPMTPSRFAAGASRTIFASLTCLLATFAGTGQAQNLDVVDGAVQSNDTAATYSTLTVSGTGAEGNPSTYSANAPLTLTNLNLYGQAVFNSNANVNVSNFAWLSGAPTLNLNSGVFTAKIMSVSGSVVRSYGTYDVKDLAVSTALTYSGGDSIAERAFVYPGGTLNLQKNLVLTGDLNVYGGVISRTTASISAKRISVGNSTFNAKAGDTVNKDWTSYVDDGGTLNVTGSVAFGGLWVHQPGSTINANAAMSALSLTVQSSGTLNINANVDVSSGIVSSSLAGVLNLTSGTLTAFSLTATGSGALIRSGGAYKATVLSLRSGAATTYTSNDRVDGVSLYDGGALTLNHDLNGTGEFGLSGSDNSVIRNGHAISVSAVRLGSGATFTTLAGDALSSAWVSGTGSLLTVSQPLSLSSMSVWNGGTMRLENFTGSWSGAGGYALSLDGDTVSLLGGYLSNGQLQFTNNPGPVTVTYDGSTFRTYVVSATGSQVVSGSTTFFGTVTGSTSVAPGGDATFAGPVAGSVTVDPGAQATFTGGVSGAATVTGSATIPGAVTGVVTAAGGGTVVITGSVAPTAQVSVGAGSTVSVGNGAAIAQPTLTNAGKFAVTNTAGNVVLPTAITGTGSFEKTGGGSVQLTGSSNFTGGSTIASGEVVVQNAKALGTGGVTVSSGGRLLVDGVDLNLGGAAVALITGAELVTTSGASVTVSGSSDLSGVRSTSPAAASAAILAGTAVSGTLATTWTTSGDASVKSEVLELKTPTSVSNPFVLSLSYAIGLDPADLFLGWNDPLTGEWVNAVEGNVLLPGMTAASGSQLGYIGSFTTFQTAFGANLSSYLGAYGRDETGRSVWAVVNHNSEFAVVGVPEPSTYCVAFAGLACGGFTMWRRRKRT